jgi:hypothetical protein
MNQNKIIQHIKKEHKQYTLEEQILIEQVVLVKRYQVLKILDI